MSLDTLCGTLEEKNFPGQNIMPTIYIYIIELIICRKHSCVFQTCKSNGICYSDFVEIGPLYMHKKACNMVDLDPARGGGPTHVKSVDWLPSVQY